MFLPVMGLWHLLLPCTSGIPPPIQRRVYLNHTATVTQGLLFVTNWSVIDSSGLVVEVVALRAQICSQTRLRSHCVGHKLPELPWLYCHRISGREADALGRGYYLRLLERYHRSSAIVLNKQRSLSLYQAIQIFIFSISDDRPLDFRALSLDYAYIVRVAVRLVGN